MVRLLATETSVENEHVLSGLIRKRAELAGEIDHLDASIRIFKPDIDLEAIKAKTVPPRHQALPGEMIRGVLTVLRESKEPLTSHEVKS